MSSVGSASRVLVTHVVNKWGTVRGVAAVLSGMALVSSAAWAQQGLQKNQRPVLSVLSLTSKLQPRLLESFEKEKNISVRVDFVGSSKEFEPRLRATPRAWDIILADERHLRRLVLSRILKLFPQGVTAARADVSNPLSRLSKVSEDGRLYSVFMADPLGLTWRASTRGATGPVQWNWLSETQKNPLWRGRLHLPSFLDFQYLIALKATEQTLTEPSDLPAATKWLKAVRSHVVSGAERVEMRYLSQEIVASVLWRSEYLALRKLVVGLEFGIPESGTFFERYGLGYVGEVQNEAAAAEFLNYVAAHQAEFARAVDLVPLNATVENEAQTAKWTLIEDEIPFPPSVTAETKKLLEPQP